MAFIYLYVICTPNEVDGDLLRSPNNYLTLATVIIHGIFNRESNNHMETRNALLRLNLVIPIMSTLFRHIISFTYLGKYTSGAPGVELA